MSEPKIVTATTTVGFGKLEGDDDDSTDAGRGSLSIEVDGREDGLNQGVTQFYAGDTVWLLLYAGSLVTVKGVISTLGGISKRGSGTRTVTEILQLSGSRQASTRYPISSIQSLSWLGRGYTVPELAVTNETPSREGDTGLVWGQKVAGAMKIEYTTSYATYRLSSNTEGSAMVLALGEVSE